MVNPIKMDDLGGTPIFGLTPISFFRIFLPQCVWPNFGGPGEYGGFPRSIKLVIVSRDMKYETQCVCKNHTLTFFVVCAYKHKTT